MLRALKRVGVSTTEADDIDDLVSEVTREDLCRQYNWPFMWTVDVIHTADGDGSYAFGSGTPGFTNTLFKDCLWIRFRESSTDEWRFLTEVSLENLYTHFPEGESSEGAPLMWAMSTEGDFEVRPIPDDIYSMQTRCVVYPAALTADSGAGSTNFFTDNYPKLLTLACIARKLLDYGEHERFQYFNDAFQRMLRDVVRQERLAEAPARGVFRPSVRASREALGLRRRHGLERATYEGI